MNDNEGGFAGAYKVVGIYPVKNGNKEPIRTASKAYRTSKVQFDKPGKDRLEGNSEITAARVARAREAYRPTDKKSKVAAAKLEKSFATSIGGAVCEWNVPFDICCGDNFIDVKLLTVKNDDCTFIH